MSFVFKYFQDKYFDYNSFWNILFKASNAAWINLHQINKK